MTPLPWIINNEAAVRLACFAGVFGLVALWERWAPRRALNFSKPVRWYSNISIAALNIGAVRLFFPILVVVFAALARERGWGLLNNVSLPGPVEIIAALLLLDFIIYLQHVMFHSLPLLWRLHRMHHTDTDYDLTTGIRFHPIEILISMGIKFGAVALIGPPPEATVLFEVILNGAAMFNHGNIRIPVALDRVLRWFVVTPDMHRVHHSIYPEESRNNFGFNVPWWDYLFGTYFAQPRDGHERMDIGIGQFRDPRHLHALSLIAQPFMRDDKMMAS
ncbi:Sterol desaturase-related protein [Candidatus Desulfarcum epimagneticum]|uniref:Sterol desaturase-related protein n=1 Tax=uncultured Desulfobacteraceae bacterium TaxID=218296 RepID=A0A484HG32_9BACT|nr:Sterol desaturase-related protein [uncultured Desulfobacteraceae bacterium]